MPVARHRVGVLAVARDPTSRWGQRGFTPSGVLPGAPATPPMSRLGPEGPLETWYLGPAELALHPGDTGHYRDNLRSGRPSVWVALRPGPPPAVAAVTADPYEGEALAGDPGLVVAAVPMPPAVAGLVAAFFAAHHVERPFQKRKRRRADPEALGRRVARVEEDTGR
jgi:hypothetical protein